jgi:hypothetical protein
MLLIPNGQMSDTSKDLCVCAGETGNDNHASASLMQPKEEGVTRKSAAGAVHTVASLPSTALVKCRVNCRGLLVIMRLLNVVK